MIPSEIFITYFKKLCPNGVIDIQNQFIIPSCKKSDINPIFDELIEKSYLVDHRSIEWFELRKKYNKEKIEIETYPMEENWINMYYHFIVGSMGEQYVMYNVNWTELFPGYKFINIGMLYNEVAQNGISPDGLLINENTSEIIPIEIKTLRQSKKLFENSYIREIKMAKIQISIVKEILCRSNIQKGIIAFLYIYEQDAEIKILFEYSIINL